MPWEYSPSEMLKAAIEQESDGVPRILLSGFSKGTKLIRLFVCFSKFGTITYIMLADQHAIIEFDQSDIVDRIIRLGNLKVEGSTVKVERLKQFLHSVDSQLSFSLETTLSEVLSSSVNFDAFLSNLVSECDASQQKQQPEAAEVVQALEMVTKEEFRECKVYPFGSRISRTSLPACDLDLYLDIGGMYLGTHFQTKVDQDSIVGKVHHAVRRHRDFKNCEAVTSARTPILRFLYLPTATHCDVAFRHGLGNENTKLILFLMSMDIRVRPMLLFVKHWATECGIRSVNDKVRFSSHSLVMLVVFYLQQLSQPVLPSIALLLALYKGRKTVIAGWECSFTQNTSSIQPTTNKQSVQELLDGFFELYRTFDYDRLVVCPLLGRAVERAVFVGNMLLLQPAMLRYAGLLREGLAERFPVKCAVCVQDPFDLSHNLTRSVKDDCLMKLISMCGLSKTACARES